VSAAALSCRDVAVGYGDASPVLRGVSFSLAAGERVALVGFNGSGKTTLLLATAGLVPHAGEIEVDGVRLERRSLAGIRGRIGFLFNVPEDQLLFPRVIDDVAFGLVARGVAAAEAAGRARRCLAALGVEPLAEAPLHRLSHGQKQRVALAGALVGEPPLLLLDEPTAGLDPPARRDLARFLGTLDAAMLIATHDLEFAARVCSRFLLLEDGRIAVDTPDVAGVACRWEARGRNGSPSGASSPSSSP
jgi:cobalt/nickel transport system ATP-binding protein